MRCVQKLMRLILVGFTMAVSLAHAAWPERPIRVVVPYSAGAAGDLVLRQMLPALQARLGQALIVDNKPGAGGNIGTTDVVRSKPDGYTLLLGATNNFVINQYLYKSMGFDPLQALQPVTKVVDVPSVLFINSTVPAKTFQEYVDYVKRNRGKLSYASYGNGSTSHLITEMLKQVHGLDPRDAEIILGTSAGSVTAAQLGAGVSGAELQAHQLGDPARSGPLAQLGWDYETATGGSRPARIASKASPGS